MQGPALHRLGDHALDRAARALGWFSQPRHARWGAVRAPIKTSCSIVLSPGGT